MRDLENLKTAAIEAGKIALGYFDKNYKTWDKDAGAGPVTEADLEIDYFLKTFLLNCEPQYGWLSEETEDGSSRLTKTKVFIVDPIDGTRSFIAGDETWAHSLAVVEISQNWFLRSSRGAGVLISSVPAPAPPRHTRFLATKAALRCRGSRSHLLAHPKAFLGSGSKDSGCKLHSKCSKYKIYNTHENTARSFVSRVREEVTSENPCDREH